MPRRGERFRGDPEAIRERSSALSQCPTGEKRVLCLLQNQWFKDPERAKKLLKTHQKHEGGYWEGRYRFIRDMLFMGCLTGKRIEAAFGKELCDYGGMIFEEASPEIHGDPRHSPEPDKDHVMHALQYYQPGVLVVLGKTAEQAALPMFYDPPPSAYPYFYKTKIIIAPHPAARGLKVFSELSLAADKVKEYLR